MKEILIIGGGVIGLSLAYEAHKRGAGQITIIDSGMTGREASYASAGMIAPQIERDVIDDFFEMGCESKNMFPEWSKDLLAETGIDVGLDQRGTLHLAFNEDDERDIHARFERQQSLGLEAQVLSARETKKLEPFLSTDVRSSLKFANDWQVDNRKLVNALRAYADLNGIKIIEHKEIVELRCETSKIGAALSDSGEEFLADSFVVASGAWSSLISLSAREIEIPNVVPVRGQMISFKTAKRLISHVLISPRGYIVPRRDGTILAGATVEDVGYQKGISDQGIEEVRAGAFEISESLINLPITEKWSGLRPISTDEMPIIGALEGIGNLFVATAHYRNGILLAPMTAKILSDKILDGMDSRFLQIYGPNRFGKVKGS